MENRFTWITVLGSGLALVACSGDGGTSDSSSGDGDTASPGTGGVANGDVSPTTGGDSGMGAGGTASGGSTANTGGNSGTGGDTINPNPTTGGDSGMGAGGTASGGSTANTGGNSGTGGDTMNPTPSSGCDGVTSLMNGRLSIDVNGMDREYILAIPDDYDPTQAYRLVFAWHQLSGSAQSIAGRGYYGLEGPSGGQAILVAPDGLVGNDRGDQGWWNNDGEDTAFYEAMLDQLTSELCIDEERIFSVGFSFGAMWSFNLACSENSALRAIAPQAGSVWGGCGGESRVATIGFVGTSDSLLDGHRNGISGLAENNGCSPDPVEMNASWCDGLGDNNLPCTCWEYQDCDVGYPVVECEYNAGHTFAPNSGQIIWDFFSQF